MCLLFFKNDYNNNVGLFINKEQGKTIMITSSYLGIAIICLLVFVLALYIHRDNDNKE